MSYNYAPLAATAKRLIERFGKAVSIRRTTASGVEWSPTITTADTGFVGVVMNYTASQVDGTLIMATDRKLLLAAQGAEITPGVDDKAVIAGNEFEIVTVKTLEPGPTAILWELQIRS